MTCREFQKRISVYSFASLSAILAGKLETAQDADLLKHLSSCPACVKTLESERQFLALIKSLAPKVQAPEYLLDKVLDQAALDGLPSTTSLISWRRPKSMRLAFASSIAAVCVLGLIIFFFLFALKPWRNEESAIFAIVDDHIRYLPSDEQRQIISSNPTEVEAWFTGKLDLAVRIPDFNVNGLRLLGGRRCYLFGQHVALLFYEKANKKLSLFILEDRHLNMDIRSWVDQGNKKVGLASCKGYNLAFCRKSGLAYILVSDLPNETLLHLTSQI